MSLRVGLAERVLFSDGGVGLRIGRLARLAVFVLVLDETEAISSSAGSSGSTIVFILAVVQEAGCEQGASDPEVERKCGSANAQT
jgi:hypothetical protein